VTCSNKRKHRRAAAKAAAVETPDEYRARRNEEFWYQAPYPPILEAVTLWSWDGRSVTVLLGKENR